VTGTAATGEPVDHRTTRTVIRSRNRQTRALLLAFSALVVLLPGVVGSAAADPSISSKQAQAEAVLAEIHQMDATLEKAVESYNYANVQLEAIRGDLKLNANHLVVAKQSLITAQKRIAGRVRALYVNGSAGGAVEVLLGAESLDDLINRLEAVRRVGAQDAQVLGDVKKFKTEVIHRKAQLEKAQAAQVSVVAERASEKQSIESQLGERERLLSSIKDQIVELKAQEARHQAALAAQARARYQAQQQAATLAAAAPPQGSATDSTLSSDLTSSDSIPVAPPSQYGGVVGIAMQYLGIPYIYGGSTPAGFDCSGFVSYVYAQVGVSLPHHAASQYNYGTPVSQSDLQPGDLVFFNGLDHVGLYIGGGQFIHSPHTGDVVKISAISGWYSDTWVGARRL
jgi:peptidoglycan DL-endopeptidase CwlO